MTLSAGLAVLFAATSIFLGLALAGALLQRQGLLRRIEQLSGESVLPSSMWGRSILLISKNCPACAAALSEVSKAPDLGLLVLAASDEEHGPDVVVDAQSWMKLYPGYTPCLVTVDGRGHVLATEPVGSSTAMRHQLQRLTTP